MEQEFSFTSTPDSRWPDSSPDPADYPWTETETLPQPIDETAPTKDQQALIDFIHWLAYSVLANIFVAIGIVGNILSIVVLSRPKLKGVMYVYLLGLAVTNLCVLVSFLFYSGFVDDQQLLWDFLYQKHRYLAYPNLHYTTLTHVAYPNPS